MSSSLVDVNGAESFPQQGRSTTGATMTEESFGSSAAVPAGTIVKAGGRVLVDCTTAGTITFTMNDGSTLPVPVTVGPNWLPLRIIEWVASNGAVATVYNLS